MPSKLNTFWYVDALILQPLFLPQFRFATFAIEIRKNTLKISQAIKICLYFSFFHEYFGLKLSADRRYHKARDSSDYLLFITLLFCLIFYNKSLQPVDMLRHCL